MSSSPAPASTSAGRAERLSLYRTMRLIRRFEEWVVELVNTNEIAGVTHEYVGEEAVAAGVCAALRPADVITSTHRGHGHVLAKGTDPARMMAELLARTTGTNRGRGGSMHIADLSLGIYGANGIVAAGAPFALGAAWVALQEGDDRVAVTFFGDGGVNQGVLHESMNLAAIWRLPVLFVCENNGYAVSMPSREATAGSIVGRAAAYGMPAVQADGMDADAVHEAAAKLIARARAGDGPAFLECLTYRFVGHHTAEATQGLTYREEAEIQLWRERDPIEVVGRRLAAEDRAAVDREVEQVLERAVEFARSSEAPAVTDALDYVYASGLRPRGGA